MQLSPRSSQQMEDSNLQLGDARPGQDAKVAIPRLRRPDYQAPTATRTRRVRSEVAQVACTQCRKRKIKCSGDRPRCINCEKQETECHYDQERKDHLREALRKNQTLTALLNTVSENLDETNRKRVEDTLKSFEDDTPPPLTPPMPTKSLGKRSRKVSSFDEQDDRSAVSGEGAEAHTSASVSSNGDLDFLGEDLLRNKEASRIGYMGRNPHAQWLRALQGNFENPGGDQSDAPYGPPGTSGEAYDRRSDALHQRRKTFSAEPFTDYDFYLDNTNIEIEIGDPHIVPSAETAEALFEFYQLAAHNPFRILDGVFHSQLQNYYRRVQTDVTPNVCAKWKALLNVVFAIGARYSHLLEADWRADDRDHLVYMRRAVHLLELTGTKSLLSAPDMPTIQATGLLSFYYLVIGHVSKAWYMVGISLRHAQAVGLHLRQEDPSTSPIRKKELARTWWGLHSIECVLTSITGRPRIISRKDCTVPPPSTMTEEQTESTTHMQSGSNLRQDRTAPGPSSVNPISSSIAAADLDSFTNAYVGIDLIMHKILSSLYSARTVTHSWKDMQKEISSLTDELEEWALQALPYEPFNAASSSEPKLSRSQLLLYFYYNSAKIYITRPCLCRLDQRLKTQSEESAKFNQKTAEGCIQAALTITSLLPEPPDPRWFYENGPWWSTVHNIMQALTVLLLELSLEGVHLTTDTSHVGTCVEKLSRWLQSMMPSDAVSERAYNIVCKVLNKDNQSSDADTLSRSTEVSTQQPYNELLAQTYNQPTTQHLEEPWPHVSFSDDFYAQVNNGNFDLNSLSVFFNDPSADVNSGQAQMPLFYGDPHMTDLNTEWDPASLGYWPGPDQ